MRRGLVLLVACGFLVLFLTAAAPATQGDDCTWGASSVMVQEVNGKLVQSEPVTTGCIPG